MHRVLVLASEGEAAQAIHAALTALDAEPVVTPDLGAARRALSEAAPDLVAIDLGLHPAADPDVAAFLASCKESSDGPLVLLVVPLAQLGALRTGKFDDFALGPSSAQELAARMQVLLRRRQPADDPSVLRTGDLVIDLARYEVSKSGKRMDLTFKEYELLKFLATNPGKVFTRETLLNRVWGYDYFGGTRTVDVHVRRLRSKIEDGTTTYIDTVRNVGYRFKDER